MPGLSKEKSIGKGDKRVETGTQKLRKTEAASCHPVLRVRARGENCDIFRHGLLFFAYISLTQGDRRTGGKRIDGKEGEPRGIGEKTVFGSAFVTRYGVAIV